MKRVTIKCVVYTDNLTDAEDSAKMMSKLFSDLVLRGMNVCIEVDSIEEVIDNG